jgi:hypothetical protein
VALAHVCPGIRIQAIDIVQPPGIGIPSIADMDSHHTMVAAAHGAKSNAEMPKKARWAGCSEAARMRVGLAMPGSKMFAMDVVLAVLFVVSTHLPGFQD